MKVGTEIRSNTLTSKIISTAVRSPNTGALSLPKILLVLVVATTLAFMPLQITWSFAHAAGTNNVWWPTEGVHLSGTQPFKAAFDGVPVEQYEMFWQVDGGSWVWMDNNYTDAPHKEAPVDVSSWNWRGAGPYKLNFIARQNGTVLAEKSVNIYIDNGQQAQPIVAVSSTPVAVASAQVPAQETSQQAPVISSTPSGSTTSNPLSGLNFYVNKNSPAALQAAEWRSYRPSDAQKMDVLAAAPTAQWFGNWSGDIQSAVAGTVHAAQSQGQAAILVAYNIPQRDCGGFSAGGSSDYTNWIGAFARGIGSAPAVVILEPDSLSVVDCLSASDKEKRMQLLSGAVSILKSNPNTKVYIDAGHSNWVNPNVMASRLQQANVGRADGFATNVSNFYSTAEEASYGSQVSSRLGGKHFVVDTARNGSGSNGEWCNPWGRSIGQKPSTDTGNSLIDAYLWVKTPGESDGNCNGGPSAGVWWPAYALGLVH